MKVYVKLFATLRDYFPELAIGEKQPLELPTGTTIAFLVQRLQLPRDEIKLIYVNGRLRPDETVLQPGDEIGLFPPVGGG